MIFFLVGLGLLLTGLLLWIGCNELWEEPAWGPISPCLRGWGMSAAQPFNERKRAVNHQASQCVKISSSKLSTLSGIWSVSLRAFNTAPLLQDDPTPLSHLCWSCHSVWTLYVATCYNYNFKLLTNPCSMCHMSLGIKLAVMTFSSYLAQRGFYHHFISSTRFHTTFNHIHIKEQEPPAQGVI